MLKYILDMPKYIEISFTEKRINNKMLNAKVVFYFRPDSYIDAAS